MFMFSNILSPNQRGSLELFPLAYPLVQGDLYKGLHPAMLILP